MYWSGLINSVVVNCIFPLFFRREKLLTLFAIHLAVNFIRREFFLAETERFRCFSAKIVQFSSPITLTGIIWPPDLGPSTAFHLLQSNDPQLSWARTPAKSDSSLLLALRWTLSRAARHSAANASSVAFTAM